MKIAVLGAGVVGKATGNGLIQLGHGVVFCDTSDEVSAELLADGKEVVRPADLDLNVVDAVMVSVPTPQALDGSMVATHLIDATKMIAEKLDTAAVPPVVIYRSTLLPGTVRNVLAPILRRTGHPVHVAYWPEYLRAHCAERDFLQPRALVLSSLEEGDRAHRVSRDIACDLTDNIHFLSLEAAELQKYVHNVGNAVKISTYNYFRKFAQRIGISEEEADRLISISVYTGESLYNPEYGTQPRGAFSGACLPKDLSALIRFSAAAGMDANLLVAVDEINRSMLHPGTIERI
jgi:nucleotide sugar dehydrogenase